MVIDFLVQFRWLWIAGRPGGGKTSLAIYLADLLVKARRARRVAINTPLIGYEPVAVAASATDIHRWQDCVIILDEAWMHIGKGAQRKDINPWLAYIRKANNYLICPSVLPLSNDFRVFEVQRQFNGMGIGLPFWLYQWRLSTGVERDKGRWVWWWPQRVFGMYDHEAKPSAEYYIYDFGEVDEEKEIQAGSDYWQVYSQGVTHVEGDPK